MAATRGLDLARMRRERYARVQAEMARHGLDALLLLTTGNVMYASGARLVTADTARGYHQRTVALVVAGDTSPHLFTPYPDGAPPELPADHLHPPVWPETPAGVDDLARRLSALLGGLGGVGGIGVDDYTAPMYALLPAALAPAKLAEAAAPMTAARLIKTADEIECMRRSWEINEAATQEVERALRPGVRLSDLTGRYLRGVFEHGATCNFLDPIFQAMPERIADGPFSVNGDVAFALVTNDHIVSQGDVIWTDTVTGYEGYASDVGRTWFVGRPTRAQSDLFARWKEITDAVIELIRPGSTGAELTAAAVAANGGTRPWLEHYFLAHGLGLEGGEPQQIGSDRGPAFDESFVLAPGMAIVVEPVVWADGHGGYRCEELLVVTDSGCEKVSRYPHEPFE